jgi:ABC-2 type transport system permease protein
MIVAIRLVRDRARGLFWWSMGMIGLVLLTVAVYPAFKDQGETLDRLLDQLPAAVRSMVGADDRIPLSSPAGYLNARLFALLAPVLSVVFTIGLGSQAIGGLEESGQLEPLVSNPVSRTRVALERYAAMVSLFAVLLAVLAVATVALAAPFGALEGLSLWALTAAFAALGCLALLFGSIAFAVGAATGRRGPAIGAASVVAVSGYLVQSLSAVTDALDVFRFVNPWHWYLKQNMLVDGVPPEAVLAPLGISVALVLAGVVAFQRRDLR